MALSFFIVSITFEKIFRLCSFLGSFWRHCGAVGAVRRLGNLLVMLSTTLRRHNSETVLPINLKFGTNIKDILKERRWEFWSYSCYDFLISFEICNYRAKKQNQSFFFCVSVFCRSKGKKRCKTEMPEYYLHEH